MSFSGPATIRMVSTNSSPPLPLPMQVPPGHMVQQILDQNGTLQHVILAPDPMSQGGPPGKLEKCVRFEIAFNLFYGNFCRDFGHL